MLKKVKNQEKAPMVTFMDNPSGAYARIFFPDEESRLEFLLKAVPDGIKDQVATADLERQKEFSMGEDGIYDAWVNRKNPDGSVDRDGRLPSVDMRDFHAAGKPERVSEFRQFIFDTLDIQSPEQN